MTIGENKYIFNVIAAFPSAYLYLYEFKLKMHNLKVINKSSYDDFFLYFFHSQRNLIQNYAEIHKRIIY